MRSMEGQPSYSTLEVAKHTGAEDAWIIIGGKVLDISTWLAEHPGGEDVLLDVAGRDATREFEDVGHSSEARSRFDSLMIGVVRASTDEELRHTRSTGSSKRKSVSAVTLSRTIVNEWVTDNLGLLRRVGTIGFAGVLTVTTAMLLRRYGTGMFSWSRR